MMRQLCRTWRYVPLSLALFVSGCGGGGSDLELEGVSGTITLDGAPLTDARVIFTPKEGGRPAFGMTDEDGYYELEYTSTSEGTPPGEYVVAIRTYMEPIEDPETGSMSEPVPERVPNTYHSPSTLAVTVPGGEYDFALDSSAGEIVATPEVLGDDSE
jgi:hypothetical protein